MRKEYFILLLVLFLTFTLTACKQDSDETLNSVIEDEYDFGYQVIQPFNREVVIPAIEFMAWHFEDEAERDGYKLIPTHFAKTGICTSSSFILTVHEEGEIPNITIDGQPDPIIVDEGDNTFRVTPSVPLSYNSLHIVRLSNITGEDTTWAFQTTVRLQVSAILPSHQSVNVPVNTGIEVSFSLAEHTPIEDFFSISPKVDGRFINNENATIFMPTDPLEFGEIYTVTIRAGIVVAGTYEVIEEDLSFSFETETHSDFESRQDHDSAQIHFSSIYMEFPSFDVPQFDFWFSYDHNNERPPIEGRIYKFTSANEAVTALNRLVNIPHWAVASRERSQIETDGLRFINSFNITQAGDDSWTETMTLPGNLPPGYYLINATVQGNTSQAILQITDIAVQIVADDEQAIVWVNDMTTGLPLSGADIINPFTRKTVQTDKNGIAIAELSTLRSGEINRLIVRADTRECIVLFHGSSENTPISGGSGRNRIIGFDTWWGSYIHPDDDYWSLLQLDRTLFQRSDTLHFWGFAASRHAETSLENITAELTSGSWWWNDGDDTPLHRQTVAVKNGSFSGEIDLPHLDPGSYRLTIYSGDTTLASMYFNVQDFIKPPYRLAVSADSRAVFAGETVNFTASGEFFEGTPVSELDVTYYLWGWQLQNDKHGNGVTNIDGVVEVSSGEIRPAPGGQGIVDLTLLVEATLPEIGWTMQQESVMVFINDIEVRGGATRSGTNASLSVEIDRITLDKINDETSKNQWDYIDGPSSGKHLTVDIVKVWWEAIRIGEEYDYITRTVKPSYKYEMREQIIESFELTTDADGKANKNFTVPNVERESYFARVKTKCGFGRSISHDVFIGRDWSGFFGNAWNNELFLDGARPWDEGYDIGEYVNLTVMHGDEKVTTGEVLFVVANMGITHYQVGVNPLEFKFTEKHMPGATVHAIYFNGHTYHSGWNMTQQIFFNRNSRELDISVSINRESFKPGEMVSATVLTRDHAGNPKPANVNISVVDEALFALSYYHIDTLTNLYRSVSSGIVVNHATHASFESDGFNRRYTVNAGAAEMAFNTTSAPVADSAENDAGGEIANTHIRELFEDTTHFQTVTTNARGEARISFKLPDNITSWRLTASGVTTDYYAGNAVENIIVTIPMFLNYSLNNVFLVGDHPFVGITVYGTDLTGEESITFTVWDAENPQDVITATGSPFERVNIPLWEMTEPGSHAIIIHTETNTGLSDAVRHSYNILESFRTVDTAVFYDVIPGTLFEAGRPGLTNITFTDRGQGQFLRQLMCMRYVRGERIEGLVMRREANRLIRQYFPDMDIYFMEDSFDPSLYQQSDGGIAMLPHASSELALTVAVLPFIRDEINIHALNNYLTNIFSSSTGENRIIALYGLAQLGAPVIQDLYMYARAENLSAGDTAYLALGLLAIGEKHRAVELYNDFIMPNLQYIAPYYRLQGDYGFNDTSVITLLAQKLEKSERNGLYMYTENHNNDDLFTQLNRLNFILHEIGVVNDSDAGITYTLFGESFTKDLSGGKHFELKIPTMNLHEFVITGITGEVGAVSIHSVALDDLEIADNDITIKRQFFAADSRIPAESFKEGDLVRVELTIDYTKKSLTGSYKVTDFLPSGLVFTQNSTGFREQYNANRNMAWATNEGQRIIFYDHNSRFNQIRTYFYYARIINPGTFTAEGTIVQNLGATDYLTIGEPSSIKIIVK
ncbi:MAG: Ig-like domain-containing protein [Oscillospiraceae bacterium]|nr:Ig-like domain-containing protein [Oscillospiraceae bacterium]